MTDHPDSERPSERTHCAGRSAAAHERTPMVGGVCLVCGEQDWPGDGPVRCAVAVPTLREWVEADQPPSLLTWRREFVPALRSLLDEHERLREALQGVLDDIRLDPEVGAPIASPVSLDAAWAALGRS